MALTGDLARNPGMCPDWESNWRPFGLQPALNPLSYTSQGCFFSFLFFFFSIFFPLPFILLIFPSDLQSSHCYLSPWVLFHFCSISPPLTSPQRVYICTLNTIPLIYVSILVLVPQCLDYYSFVASFEFEKCCFWRFFPSINMEYLYTYLDF